MNELHQRLSKINHLQNLDAILLINKDMQFNPNFIYLTDSEDIDGFLFYDFHKPKLFTNQRDLPLAKKSWVKDSEVAEKETLKNLINGKKIGVDFSALHADTYLQLRKKAKMVDITKHLEQARIQKTQYEISCIREACKITSKVLKTVENQWNGMTEIEFKGLMEYEMHRLGVHPSFPTIVATGANIAVPHHRPTTQRIHLPLLIDFGVRYKNYISDATRTYGSKWEPLIENMLDDLYHTVKLGMPAKDLDGFVRKALGKNERHFITALGHGIGIAVHERPWVSKRSEDVLKEGMTFTIEPGVYVKNGIRIENDFLMKEDGLEMLTKF